MICLLYCCWKNTGCKINGLDKKFFFSKSLAFNYLHVYTQSTIVQTVNYTIYLYLTCTSNYSLLFIIIMTSCFLFVGKPITNQPKQKTKQTKQSFTNIVLVKNILAYFCSSYPYSCKTILVATSNNVNYITLHTLSYCSKINTNNDVIGVKYQQLPVILCIYCEAQPHRQ